jgi:hypothetical protein
MASLTGTQIANTYKQLLQVGSGNVGLGGTLQTVQDGDATNSPLQLSDSAVNINGTFQLSGVTLTASASTLNAVADLTGATGLVAVSAGNVYGRTLVAGTGITIGNADGTEGNPTIAMVTATTSGSYKGPNDIEVNAVGQIVSISPAVSVSVATIKSAAFEGGTFVGSSGGFETNVSMGGDLTVNGDATFSGNVIVSGTVSIERIAVSSIDVTRLSATSGVFTNTVSAAFFVGDGSGLINVPSAEGGTMKFITAGTGINFTVNGVTSATIPVSGTVNINTNQSFGIVSATNIDADELLMAGVSAANVTEVAAVSVLTKTNLDAITSINAVIGDGSGFATDAELAAVSATLATSINNSNTRITSVSDFAVALSATLATSIGNSNTNITINANAITSINNVVANVSALTSVNAAAITSINAVIEGNVSADSGTFNTLTVVTSASVGGTFNVGGNVGIGTPSGILDLSAATGSGTLNIISTVNATNAGNKIAFFAAGRSDTDEEMAYIKPLLTSNSGGSGNVQAGHLTFGTSGSERMRITSTGNVGIGTTNPAVELEIASSQPELRFTDTDGTDQESTFVQAGGTLYLNLQNNTSDGAFRVRGFASGSPTDHFLVNGSGNVGIGTASPSRPLHISASDCRIRLTDSDADTISVELHNSSGSGILSTNGASSLLFQTNNAERMRIDSSGNVGIGTSSPDTNLHVVAATTGGQFIVASTETDATNKVGTVATQHYTNAEEPVLGLAIQSTSTENKVFIGGVFTQFNAATEIRFYTTSNNTTLGGSERVRINSSGNVGIGTTAPAKQLHITKAAKADIGTLTDGATITPDFDANQNFSVTLGGNRTLANPSNIDAGQTGSIFVVQDGTGSRTLSFGSYWKFAGGTAPTLSTAAGSVDRIDYIVYTTTAIHAVATLNVS